MLGERLLKCIDTVLKGMAGTANGFCVLMMHYGHKVGSPVNVKKVRFLLSPRASVYWQESA